MKMCLFVSIQGAEVVVHGSVWDEANAEAVRESQSPGRNAYIFPGYNRSDWRFCACAINVKSSMCSEKTKHLWYKYYGLFVRMYITSQQSYLSQINTRGKQLLRHILIASVNHVTVVCHNPWQWFIQNVILYCIERHFTKLFTVITTGELTNSSWHLYQKCFVVLLDIDDFTFIAHAQKLESF